MREGDSSGSAPTRLSRKLPKILDPMTDRIEAPTISPDDRSYYVSDPAARSLETLLKYLADYVLLHEHAG